MPAKDRLHDTVVRALVKDGWTVVEEQYTLDLPERRLWVDIYASKSSQNLVVLVEVKAFENMNSPVDYLAGAAGKYALYLETLDYAQLKIPLYMAVTEKGYNGILSETIGQRIIRRFDILLMVFNPETEEIIRWIPTP